MAAGPQPAIRYSFGPYEADPASGELFKFGTKIRVANKPFQILITLIERPGEVVTRESLRSQLWNDDTFVDFEHGLNAAMNKIRQALGDEASNPRFIETLPGRGYRFMAAVEIAGLRPTAVVRELPRAESPPPQPTPPAVRTRVPWPWMVAGIGIAASLALLGYWAGGRTPAVPVPSPAVRFTIPAPAGTRFEPSSSRQALVLSPDGQKLAFTARQADGVMSICVRDLAASEPRLLPRTRGAYSLAWSGDGQSLYFTGLDGLMRIALTGEPQLLAARFDPTMLRGMLALPGGKLLLGGNTNRSFVVPSSGGNPQDQAAGFSWPSVWPGGREFISTRWNLDRNAHEARLTPVDSLNPGRLLLDSEARVFVDRGRILYLKGGDLLARGLEGGESSIAVAQVPYFRPTGAVDATVAGGNLAWLDRPNRSQLVWRNRRGEETGAVGQVIEGSKWVRLSADGRTALLNSWEQRNGVAQLWTADLSTGAMRKVTTEPRLKDSPLFSPDARRIAYGRSGYSAPTLHMIALEDGVPVDPLPAKGTQLPSDWSPDGRFIAVNNSVLGSSGSSHQGNIDIVDLARGRELLPLVATPHHESNLVFAPGTRAVAFISTDSGRAELYVQAFDPDARRLTGIRRQVSRNGAQLARWPKPGHEIYFLSADSRIHAVTISSSLVPGEPQPLFTVDSQMLSQTHTTFGFDVEPGGQRFLMLDYRGDYPLRLQVVLNWESLLGARNKQP